MARLIRKLAGCLLVGLLSLQCNPAQEAPPPNGSAPAPDESPADTALHTPAGQPEPVFPLVSVPDLDAARVELGGRLFQETALSGPSKQVSCATCHPLDSAGTASSRPDYPGPDANAPYDIPTVFNTAHHFAWFWNGRAQSLEGVIQSSIRSENVMNSSWGEIVTRLGEMEAYRADFDTAYPGEGIAESTVEDALVQYLRSLSTPNAAFDRWLIGEPLPERTLEGYALFKDYGCIRCHQGIGIGGNMYASFAGYISGKEGLENADYGRFGVTNNEAHRFQFKVPSLRNVAVTAPYFHDGSAEKLEDAIKAMALHQLGRTLKDSEVERIAAFLDSLTGWRNEKPLGAVAERTAG